ncbi:hypothetical protein HG15A2_48230 [Adhaeretor mobilis]|uniref:Transposase n=1 Tax=Adhaeretor mobilis TaxID=1930276 RepID=A0A517N2W4_9BACT|nr:hypothetical protein HG15A2_48230 [Adhaeretor mobilis]
MRTILKEEGLHPGPKRGPGTWDEFLKIHADTLWQCDFFSKMAMTSSGLRQAYVLAFLHVKSRRVICSPATIKPDDKWVAAQAESMLEQTRGMDLPVRYLVRDLDFKYSNRFDRVFTDNGVSIEPTALGHPIKMRSSNAGLVLSGLSASTDSLCLAWATSTASSHVIWIIIIRHARISGRKTSLYSVSGRRSMIRRLKTTRSSVESGWAAYRSTTNAKLPEKGERQLRSSRFVPARFSAMRRW